MNTLDLRLFVIEPHPFRRRLVGESVAAIPGFVLAGAAASLRDIDTGPPTPSACDIFLLNASLLPEESAALRAAAARYPVSSFLLYDTRSELGPLLASLDLPVAGFLTFNHLSKEDFSRSLEVVAHGGAVIEPYTAQLLLTYLRELHLPLGSEADGCAQLTQREYKVLGLVRQGLSNKEIGRQLQISLGTVRAHLRSIFRKLDVSSRAGAAAYFRPRGLREQPRRLGHAS